jgi:predicted dehydrogenase
MTTTAPVRIALLTTASINANLLETRTGSDPYEFIAIGSRNPDRATTYARELEIPRAYGSYEELLRDEDVEAIYIAMPNALHYEWSMRALAAGKHVLCEKPFSRHPEHVERAFDAAEASGLVLLEGYMWRHNLTTRRLAERLPEIGRLVTIRATFSFALDDPHDVRLNRDIGGGSLLDVGCYCVSAARFVAGRNPDTVYGEAVLGESGVDEQFTAVLRFGDITAEFTCGFRSSHRSLEVIGSAGAISVVDPWLASTGELVVNGHSEQLTIVSPYRLELENFARAVRGDAEPLVGRDESLGQAYALDALLRSAEAGVPVNV